ncbi:unnamed protein product [Penicillium bialowiezense]
MESQGFSTIRSSERYYIYHYRDNCQHGRLDANVVDSIPTDPQQYQEFLGFRRTKCMTRDNIPAYRIFSYMPGRALDLTNHDLAPRELGNSRYFTNRDAKDQAHEVIVAEASLDDGARLSIRASLPMNISPLCPELCTSTHPRHRPERDFRVAMQKSANEIFTYENSTGSVEELQVNFPGLAAIVNFFEVASNRQAAFRSVGILPPELCQQAVESVDFETWQSCSKASIVLRAGYLRDHRLNDRMAIVGGSFERCHHVRASPTLSFNFKDMRVAV